MRARHHACSTIIFGLASSLLGLGGCVYDAPIGKDDAGGDARDAAAPDVVMPDATPSTCASSADCPGGSICTGPEGCGVPWTCQSGVVCTDDLVTFCACDGHSYQGSSSCPGRPRRHVGPCETVLDAGAETGVCNILCVAGTYCDTSTGTARCLPYNTCATSPPPCAADRHCEDAPIVCFAPPCPPTAPTCVPNAPADAGTPPPDGDVVWQYPTCATTLCGPRETCRDVPIQCVTTPCPPTAPFCTSTPDAGIGTYPTCATYLCGMGLHCHDVAIECFAPPCPPSVPVCY